MMWEAARDRVVEHGNHVLMGHALKQLRFDDATRPLDASTATDRTTARVTINAAHIISSAPMRELAGAHPPAAGRASGGDGLALSRLSDGRSDD